MLFPKEFLTIEKFARVFAGRVRLRILYLLRNGEMRVLDIQRALGLPQNLVSYHLRLLREMEIITVRRVGVSTYCGVNHTKIKWFRQIYEKTFNPNGQPAKETTAT